MNEQNIIIPNQSENTIVTLYSDMDGVMVVYDRTLYIAPDGEIPPYLQLGGHIFTGMKPHENYMAAYNAMYTSCKNSTKVKTKVLTNVPVGLLQAEHTLDKYYWCEAHIKGFNREDFFCISVPKHDAISQSLWQLTEKDILCDDYQPNLANWREHGGTAIKVLNGINSINPDYDYIDVNWSTERIIAKMQEIINSVI